MPNTTAKITVQDSEITIISVNDNDYISLTDIAKLITNDIFIVICNWMRNRNTIEYLGIWETLYNPNFKPIEFDRFKKEAGLHAFTMSPKKWIESWSYDLRPIISNVHQGHTRYEHTIHSYNPNAIGMNWIEYNLICFHTIFACGLYVRNNSVAIIYNQAYHSTNYTISLLTI